MPNEVSHSINYLVAQFIERLMARNLSKYTIQDYCYMLKCFVRFLEDNQIKTVEKISKKILLDYQTFNSQEKNKQGRMNTIVFQNFKLKVAAYFCKFLYENDHVNDNPARGVQYAKQPKLLPRNVPSEGEVAKIIEQPNLNIPLGFRDRAILEVLYSSGIRKAELINLDLADVDYQQGTMIIRQGKGNKDRYVPVGQVACQFLEAYIHHVRGLLLKGQPSPALFVSLQCRRISLSYLCYVIKKYVKKAGIKKRITTHSFRHACATHLVNRGMDIRHVQVLLGHSCLSSTQVYTRVGIEDLKRVIKKYHPREKKIESSS